MRKVIDSNWLQSPELRSYLSKSKQNIAILTDYAAMEAYQGNTLIGIYKSMEIVADYPDQILILKSTALVCGLSGRSTSLQKRLIDDKQSKDFRIFIRNLRLAKHGNQTVQRQLLKYSNYASEHLNKMLEDAKTTGAAFDDLTTSYSKDEKKLIRNQGIYTYEMIDKIVKAVLKVVGDVLKDHPNVQNFPTYEELPNTFIFRATLCTYLLALNWGATGGAKDVRTKKLRNDMIDMNFVAYATYFDGILSEDAKVNLIYREACLFLSALFACQISGKIYKTK
ncbi:MAG: hypothetical protein WC696_02490 [Candidatus Methylopumilus sp.]|jgi:hypothetical protein